MLREWAGEHGGGLSMRLSIDGTPPGLTPMMEAVDRSCLHLGNLPPSLLISSSPRQAIGLPPRY